MTEVLYAVTLPLLSVAHLNERFIGRVGIVAESVY
jgi:hypothetical protein